MAIAALVAWVITALGGFWLLAKWVAGGGHRKDSSTKIPPALIFGHFLLAAAGLVLWIIYAVVPSNPLGWVAFVVLLPVALLGFTMLARWIPVYRSRTGEGAAPERGFPVVVVIAHGVLAVVTLVLVLLTDLNIGTS
jgi:manganese efflux pump family protein